MLFRSSRGAQLLVAALAADNYLGKYAIGKIFRGKLKKGENVKVLHADPETGELKTSSAKVENIFAYKGLSREEVPEAEAGDIIAVSGVQQASIGDTIATPGADGSEPEALPTIELEAPTLSIYMVAVDAPVFSAMSRYVFCSRSIYATSNL